MPQDAQQAQKLVAQESVFTVIDDILYFVDPKCDDRRRAAVPTHLRLSLMEESHSGPMADHFSAEKLYKTLARQWW